MTNEWAVSKYFETYEEAKRIAEGTTLMLGTTEHVKVLWTMLEAAKTEIAELGDRLYQLERPNVFDKVD